MLQYISSPPTIRFTSLTLIRPHQRLPNLRGVALVRVYKRRERWWNSAAYYYRASDPPQFPSHTHLPIPSPLRYDAFRYPPACAYA